MTTNSSDGRGGFQQVGSWKPLRWLKTSWNAFHRAEATVLMRGGGAGSVMAALGCAVAILCAGAVSVRADQVEMRNGDRYVGKVMSLDDKTLVVASEVLGKVRLAREKVLTVKFGNEGLAEAGSGAGNALGTTNALGQLSRGAGVTNSVAPVVPGASNGEARVSPALPSLGISSNLIAQVQKQFLSNADPAATEKFNELLGGLLNGKMSVEDVRAQAKSMAEQIRSVRKDLDEESGWMIDFYLGVLDRFVKETEQK